MSPKIRIGYFWVAEEVSQLVRPPRIGAVPCAVCLRASPSQVCVYDSPPYHYKPTVPPGLFLPQSCKPPLALLGFVHNIFIVALPFFPGISFSVT